MSEESALAFRKLVAEMRFTQKRYWETRDNKLLRKSIELEKRVDDIIMKAKGSDVPNNKKGFFFLRVAELRVASKEYFAAKKEYPPDKEKIKDFFEKVKLFNHTIDKQLEHFQDEEDRKNGYVVHYHVMERYPRQTKAHSIFSSSDENLVKAELNDYLRRASGGVMYFMGKTKKPIQE